LLVQLQLYKDMSDSVNWLTFFSWGNCSQDWLSGDSWLNVGCCAQLTSQELVDSVDIILRRSYERYHTCTITKNRVK